MPDNPSIFVPLDIPNLTFDSMENINAGKFVTPYQNICWSDPTNLFTKYTKSSEIGNQNSIILLNKFYTDQNAVKNEQIKQVFLAQFQIKQTPSLEEYVQLLDHATMISMLQKSPFSYEETVNDVLSLFKVIYDKCAELSIGSSINNEISDSVRDHFLRLIGDKKIIPCFGKKWCSINGENTSNPPILIDSNYELAEKFADKLKICIINPSVTSANQEFYDLCCFNTLNPIDEKLNSFFNDLLQINTFSSVLMLDLENITESLREAPEIQNICYKILPFIQLFLNHRPELKVLYTHLNTIGVREKLLRMKFYSVKELQNIYRFRHDPSIYISVSNKTCADTSEKSAYWKYFVRADSLSNFKDIVRGFLKVFIQNSSVYEKCEKELLGFCLLMNEFKDLNTIKIDDRAEIEKDFRIKLNLPNGQEKWEINEVETNKNYSNLSNEHFLNESEKKVPNVLKKTDFKQDGNLEGMTKRQKLMIYDQLSSNQINLPCQNSGKPNNFAIASQSSIKISLDSLESNLSSMASSLNNSNILNQNVFSSDSISILENIPRVYSNLSGESETVLRDLNNLREEIQHENDANRVIDKDFLQSVGRWGELWVNEMLKRQYRTEINNNQVVVEWMNEQNESGLPYDFRITFNDNMVIEEENKTAKFIEVKSTTREWKEAFSISYKELFFAQKYSKEFEIYRVFNAGSADMNSVNVKIIRDLPELLNSHGANMFIVI
jgi:hypothetical protein